MSASRIAFFDSIFFLDLFFAVVASRKMHSVAGDTKEVIGGTRFCVMVTIALCTYDGRETSVSNLAVKLAVKTLDDLALRDVAFNLVRLTVSIQVFPDCIVGQVWSVKFYLNTCSFEPCDV